MERTKLERDLEKSEKSSAPSMTTLLIIILLLLVIAESFFIFRIHKTMVLQERMIHALQEQVQMIQSDLEKADIPGGNYSK